MGVFLNVTGLRVSQFATVLLMMSMYAAGGAYKTLLFSVVIVVFCAIWIQRIRNSYSRSTWNSQYHFIISELLLIGIDSGR